MIVAIGGRVDEFEVRVGVLHYSVGILISSQNPLNHFRKVCNASFSVQGENTSQVLETETTEMHLETRMTRRILRMA